MAAIDEIRKPSINYRNDLDECLVFYGSLLNLPNFRILFYGLPSLLSNFNQLLSVKVPKLLDSYGVN